MTVILDRTTALPAPHGGRLVGRLVSAGEHAALAAEAARPPAVALDGLGLADLECLAVGAFSPLTGFLGAHDHAAVVEQGRLADGTVWTRGLHHASPSERFDRALATLRADLAAGEGRPERKW